MAQWQQLKKQYGLREDEIEIKAMDQTLMYGAVVEDQLDVIVAYTSDGRMKAYRLEVLEDPEGVFPPYDAILLVSSSAARRPGFVDALRPLIGAIDLDTMREANKRVDVDGESPAKVSAWLLETIEKNQSRARVWPHER